MVDKLRTVLSEALKLATPSSSEEKRITEAAKSFSDVINSCCRKKKVNAELTIGGSVAKGTWLPGATDVDCFLRFDYEKYKNRKDLSDMTEKVLKPLFKDVDRLHGSRDYFQIKHKGYTFEIVPVLKIKKVSEAKNITDVSQLHVDFVRKHITLASDIRLAKQFCKGCGVYGAESYIRGFSGHIIEILTIYYHGFVEFVSIAGGWSDETFIDSVSYYEKQNKNPLQYLNPSKTEGPLVVVDSVQPDRNAAAAVSKEKYDKLRECCKAFLKSPSIDFFKLKTITITDLKAKSAGKKLIVLSAKVPFGKKDVVGASLLKRFEYISKQLELANFVTLDKGWQWDERKNCVYWFCFDLKPLSPLVRRLGPPASDEKRLADFKRKHGKKVKVVKGVSYVDLKRKRRTPKAFLEELLKTTKGISFY